MTLHTVNPVLTNSVVNTSKMNISPAMGAIRFNTTISSFELYDGTYWQPALATQHVIKDFLEQAKTGVIEHINKEHAGNVTINDALETWLEACDKFKVIIAIAGKSK